MSIGEEIALGCAGILLLWGLADWAYRKWMKGPRDDHGE